MITWSRPGRALISKLHGRNLQAACQESRSGSFRLDARILRTICTSTSWKSTSKACGEIHPPGRTCIRLFCIHLARYPKASLYRERMGRISASKALDIANLGSLRRAALTRLDNAFSYRRSSRVSEAEIRTSPFERQFSIGLRLGPILAPCVPYGPHYRLELTHARTSFGSPCPPPCPSSQQCTNPFRVSSDRLWATSKARFRSSFRD
jgi:hypothetical protein